MNEFNQSTMKYESFDQYLQHYFMEHEPESVGCKDTFEDNFDTWLGHQDNKSLTAIAREYVAHFIPQYDVVQEELSAGISERFQRETFGELIAWLW